MDKDKDGKVSLSEWLSGTEAIADFVGEEPFLTALLGWSKLEKSGARSKMKQAGRLHEMIMTEMTRKRAKGEPFEEPGSAGLTPPFADAKAAEKRPAQEAEAAPQEEDTGIVRHSYEVPIDVLLRMSTGGCSHSRNTEPLSHDAFHFMANFRSGGVVGAHFG